VTRLGIPSFVHQKRNPDRSPPIRGGWCKGGQKLTEGSRGQNGAATGCRMSAVGLASPCPVSTPLGRSIAHYGGASMQGSHLKGGPRARP
jgi:hypothetical protein